MADVAALQAQLSSQRAAFATAQQQLQSQQAPQQTQEQLRQQTITSRLAVQQTQAAFAQSKAAAQEKLIEQQTAFEKGAAQTEEQIEQYQSAKAKQATYNSAVEMINRQIRKGWAPVHQLSSEARAIYNKMSQDPSIAQAIERGGDIAWEAKERGFSSSAEYQQFQALIPEVKIQDTAAAKMAEEYFQQSIPPTQLPGKISQMQRELSPTPASFEGSQLQKDLGYDVQQLPSEITAPLPPADFDTTSSIHPLTFGEKVSYTLSKVGIRLPDVERGYGKMFGYAPGEKITAKQIPGDVVGGVGTVASGIWGMWDPTSSDAIPSFVFKEQLPKWDPYAKAIPLEGEPRPEWQVKVFGEAKEVTIPGVPWRGTTFGGEEYGPEIYRSKRKVTSDPFTLTREKLAMGASIAGRGALLYTGATVIGFQPIAAAKWVEPIRWGVGVTSAIGTAKAISMEVPDRIDINKPQSGFTQETWKSYLHTTEGKAYSQQIKEYNKGVGDFKRQRNIGIAAGVVGTGLMFAPEVGGLFGRIPRKALGGLSKTQFRELSKLSKAKQFTPRYYELRGKAFRGLEKGRDTLGIRAFQDLFKEAKIKGKYPATAIQEAKELSLRAEKARLFPSLLEKPTIQTTTTFGKAKVTKGQFDMMVGKLVDSKFYKTEKAAIKALEDRGIGVQKMEVGLATKIKVPKHPFQLLEGGEVHPGALKIKTIKLPKLSKKYFPSAGPTEFKSYVTTVGRKVEGVTTEAQFGFTMGRGGKLTHPSLTVVRGPKDSLYFKLDRYLPGKKSIKTWQKGGLKLKQQWFDPYKKAESYIGKVESMQVAKTAKPGEFIRRYGVTFKSEFPRPRRVGPEDWLTKLSGQQIPTKEALKKAYSKGAVTERQVIGELVTPKGVEVKWYQAGLKKQQFPGIDETLFLGEVKEVSKKYIQRTWGAGKAELPMKKFPKFDFKLKPKAGGPIPGVVGGEVSVGAGVKQIQKTVLDQPLKISPILKPPKPRVPSISMKPIVPPTSTALAPRMVGGLGVGMSEWYGKKIEAPSWMETGDVASSGLSFGTITGAAVSTNLGGGQISAPSLDIKPAIKPTVRPIVTTVIKPALQITPAIKPAIKPALRPALQLKPVIKPAIKPVARPAMVPMAIPAPPVPPIKPIRGYIWDPSSAQQRRKAPIRRAPAKPVTPGFKVEVKRKGVWRPTPGVYGKETAKFVGMKTVVGEAAASFRLKKARRAAPRRAPVTSPLGLKVLFRPGKKAGTYVQKKRFRILTPGEKKEISYKGALATKKGPGQIKIRKPTTSPFTIKAPKKKKPKKKAKKKAKKKTRGKKK